MKESWKRFAHKNKSRGHATFFDVPREHEHREEVDRVRKWAKTMRAQHGWDVRNIRKNPRDTRNQEVSPDCLADLFDDSGRASVPIGIEVTELVDSDAINAYSDARRLAKKARRSEISDAEVMDLHRRMNPLWPLEDFEAGLTEKLRVKDTHWRDEDLEKLFLLFVTGEPNLDKALIAEHLSKIELPRPQIFDAVYLMMSYMPSPPGDVHYRVFEVPLATSGT